MKSEFANVERLIDGYKEEMVKKIVEIVGIKSISAKSGGEGESARADFLSGILKQWGIASKRYEYVDDAECKRISLIAKHGSMPRTIWVVGHIDTVAAGDLAAWKTDPFKAKIDGDRIYGRGTNDDGQGVIGSMYALKALRESKAKLKYNVGLVLAGNEEEGSRYGMQKLMQEGIFNKDDMFMVPDFGIETGDQIDIGEKGMLWLKVTVIGKQVHASTPADGVNAFRYMIKLLAKVDEHLHKKYTKRDKLFHPSYSTFEMTKHEKNVDSVNIIPGKEVAYLDSRVLPEYTLDEIISDIRKIADGSDFKEVKIELEAVNREDAVPITKKDAEIVKLLQGALKDVRGINPKLVGIGGGTCAAFPRREGMEAAVWGTFNNTSHGPNEYLTISSMMKDTKVLAYLYI